MKNNLEIFSECIKMCLKFTLILTGLINGIIGGLFWYSIYKSYDNSISLQASQDGENNKLEQINGKTNN